MRWAGWVLALFVVANLLCVVLQAGNENRGGAAFNAFAAVVCAVGATLQFVND